MTCPSPPYDGRLIFASTRKIITVMTPLEIPHLVRMNLQNGGRDSREIVLSTMVVRIEGKPCIRRWIVVCTSLPL